MIYYRLAFVMQAYSLTGPLFDFQKNIDNLSVKALILFLDISPPDNNKIIIKTYILGGFRKFDINPPFSTKACMLLIGYRPIILPRVLL